MRSAPNSRTRFIAASERYVSFFAASPRDGHFLFDLPGFIAMRLRLAGIGSFEDFGARYLCRARDVFYSYRRSVHKNRTRLRPPDRCDRALVSVTQAAAFATIVSAAAFGSAGAPSQAVLRGNLFAFHDKGERPQTRIIGNMRVIEHGRARADGDALADQDPADLHDPVLVEMRLQGAKARSRRRNRRRSHSRIR